MLFISKLLYDLEIYLISVFHFKGLDYSILHEIKKSLITVNNTDIKINLVVVAFISISMKGVTWNWAHSFN